MFEFDFNEESEKNRCEEIILEENIYIKKIVIHSNTKYYYLSIEIYD